MALIDLNARRQTNIRTRATGQTAASPYTPPPGTDTTLYDGGGGNVAPDWTPAGSENIPRVNDNPRFNTTAVAAQPWQEWTPGGANIHPQAPNGSEFTDPSQMRIEQHAINQFNQTANPAAGSAARAFEDYLGQLGQTLQQPAYSTSDASIYTGAALDSIEREKSAAKQRWVEELGRRNIAPSSGIALDGLMKIDNHYAGLRTTQQTDFAKQAITDTRQQRMQAADVLGQRVTAENQRGQQAAQWAAQPYQLVQDSFARNASVANAQQPQSYLNSQIQMANGRYAIDQQQAAQQANSQQQWLEYLAYMGYL